METHSSTITDLLARAPWREAATYRETWPHGCVVIQKDRQRELLAAFCQRILRGEGVEGRFFHRSRQYLFLGDHKCWTMTECINIDPDDYPYSPSVEPRIVQTLGGIYGPYTGTWFQSIRETDIEHIVARSEAHDSGLCAASPATRAEFASDLLNLTLASPSVNRHQKVAKDAAEWLPELNRCWYVDRTVQVRREYWLSIDRAEADAIESVLAECESTEMVALAPGASATAAATPTPTAPENPSPDPGMDDLALWDDNGNSRITCAEARAHGIAPVRRGHPAYQYMRDADGDGVVCE